MNITLTYTVDIPHFKEVIIMATTCDSCGNRTNEVKAGCKLLLDAVHVCLHPA